ncbi:MAG: hypothetical protein HRU46_08290 [Verrucomicrobiales bacterium]|nr:hypothetical protein [Verrucomicrobiales bacterium]
MFRLPFITVLLGFALVLAATGQEYHQFTSKDGKQMSAMLLDISPDNRQVKIRREDGLEFEFEIVGLSLDDQQHIKDWLKTRVVEIKTDYRLEMDIDHNSTETERHRKDSYSTYEQRFGAYKVIARNLSRETLPAAFLEYVVIWKEYLRVYENEETGWTYSTSGTVEDPKVKLSGEIPLGEMVYNRDVEVMTEISEINRYLFDGKVSREDELVGVKLRIKDAHGNVLLEEESAGAEIEQISWDDAMEVKTFVPRT